MPEHYDVSYAIRYNSRRRSVLGACYRVQIESYPGESHIQNSLGETECERRQRLHNSKASFKVC